MNFSKLITLTVLLVILLLLLQEYSCSNIEDLDPDIANDDDKDLKVNIDPDREVTPEMQDEIKKEERGRRYYKQADKYAKQNNLEKAVQYYIKALDNLKTNKNIVQFNLGMAYHKLKRYDEAVAVLMKVLPTIDEKKEENAENLKQLYRLLGDSCGLIGKWDCASTFYEKLSILIDDSHPSLLNNLGRSLLALSTRESLKKSVAVFKKLMNKFPQEFESDKGLICEYGVALTKIQDNRGKDTLTKCRKNVKDAAIHINVARRLVTSNVKAAKLHLEHIIALYNNWYEAPFGREVAYYLGSAYRNLDMDQEEMELYNLAVAHNLFLHPSQRPRTIFKKSNGEAFPLLPWLYPQENDNTIMEFDLLSNGDITSNKDDLNIIYSKVNEMVTFLMNNTEILKSEIMVFINARKAKKSSVLHEHTTPDEEGILSGGKWNQLPIFNKGLKSSVSKYLPKSSSIIESFLGLYADNLPLGVAEISMLSGDLDPHCGTSNHKIRLHLGLDIPRLNHTVPTIRVANTTKVWEEGKVLVFDDSFEHEIFNPTKRDRIVLILDAWHPLIPFDSDRNVVRKYFNFKVSE